MFLPLAQLDTAELVRQVTDTLRGFLPDFLVAVGILLVGWLIAIVLAAIVRRLVIEVARTQRFAGITIEEGSDREKAAAQLARATFWIAMFFALVFALQALHLPALSTPIAALLESVFGFLPRIIGAVLLLIAAWVIGGIVRFAVRRLFDYTHLDERLAREAALENEANVSRALANVAYWMVYLLLLPAILKTLQIEGLEPLQAVVDQLLKAVPNAFAAALVLLIGWFLARIVRQIVTNLLAAAGIDDLGTRAGLQNTVGRLELSKSVGTIVYALVLIPVIIQALDALKVEAISLPAINMLDTIIAAIPGILGAVLLLAAAYVVGRVVADLATTFLAGLGFDGLLSSLGLGPDKAASERSPSQVAGYLVLVVIMLIASSEAADLLGFRTLSDLLGQVLAFLGQVAVAAVVFAVGVYLANLARRVILTTGGPGYNIVAEATRIVVIVFAGAMALAQMEIADQIVTVIVAAAASAIALAGGLAFGLGGKEVAGRQLEAWHAALSRRGEGAGRDH